MRSFQAKFQIGKQGLTQSFIDSVALAFKKRKHVRVSVLKSCTRDKGKIKEIAEELSKKLPFNLKIKILGFTIILVKQ